MSLRSSANLIAGGVDKGIELGNVQSEMSGQGRHEGLIGSEADSHHSDNENDEENDNNSDDDHSDVDVVTLQRWLNTRSSVEGEEQEAGTLGFRDLQKSWIIWFLGIYHFWCFLAAGVLIAGVGVNMILNCFFGFLCKLAQQVLFGLNLLRQSTFVGCSVSAPHQFSWYLCLQDSCNVCIGFCLTLLRLMHSTPIEEHSVVKDLAQERFGSIFAVCLYQIISNVRAYTED